MTDKEKIGEILENLDRKLFLLDGECTEKGKVIIDNILYEEVKKLKKHCGIHE